MVEPGTGDGAGARAVAADGRATRDEGETFLNYVVPEEYGDSNGFQAGSTFKAFVLAAAIEQGIPLTTTLQRAAGDDHPADRVRELPGRAGNFVGDWDGRNSTSSGTMDLYRGTQESVNTFYALLERATGVCEPFQLAKDDGRRAHQPDGRRPGPGAERVPTFTLGVANVSPLEMAEAYATFAARGLHCDSRPVTEIEDADGNLLKKYRRSCTQVMRAEHRRRASTTCCAACRSPAASATTTVAPACSVPSAGKTGTTQDGKSVWFVGYTPQRRHRRDDRRRQQGRQLADRAGRPDHRRQLHLRAPPGPASPGRCGPARCTSIEDTLPYEDFVAAARRAPSTASGAHVPCHVAA